MGQVANQHPTNMTETEIELPANLDTEDAIEVLEAAGDTNDAKVVEAHKYEALTDAVTTLEGMMSDHLVEERGLAEETVEAMSFEAMSEEFKGDDGDFDAESLVQQPETEQPDEEIEALSDADVEKAEALFADYQTFGNEALKSDIQDKLGVSDWDTAQEVLE